MSKLEESSPIIEQISPKRIIRLAFEDYYPGTMNPLDRALVSLLEVRHWLLDLRSIHQSSGRRWRRR
ncbi:hypothetical protein LguiA_008701 [Lonicera macranthoides]